MNNSVNHTLGLAALHAQLEALAHDEAQLHGQLERAAADVGQRQSDIERALDELRAALAQHSSTPDAPRADAQRVSNKYIAYQQLIGRIREVAYNILPRDATVLVASRGDEDLVQLDVRAAWHFPRGADGKYAGYYPKDSAAAIEHLESLRAAGAEYLVFPETAFWWLDYYAELKQHLEQNYRVVAKRDETCIIFALCASAVETEALPRRDVRARRKAHVSKNGNGKHKS